MMEWASIGEVGTAYGQAIAGGLMLGTLIVLFNSWRPSR